MRLAVLALVLTVSSALAGPSQDLDRGRSAFRTGDYQSSKAMLNTLLYPKVELAQGDEIWECRVLLGASLYHLGDRTRAVKEFELALQLDIERSITTNLYRQDVVTLFEDTKARVKADLELKRKIKEQQEREQRIKDYLNTIGVYETNSRGVSFVPVAAQYQNKQRAKGLLFGAGMAVTGGTSLGIFIYLAGKYGLSSNQVPLADGPGVRRLQQIEIGTGIAFFGIYVWGVIDAFIHFKAQRRIRGDDSLIPIDLIDPSKPAPPKPALKKKTSLRDRLRIGPILTPSGAGIGLGLETD